MNETFLKAWTDGLIKCSAVAMVAAALSACAWLDPNGQRPKPVIVQDLDVNVMNEVFVKGFGEIKERAFDDPDLDKLFMAGLAGLKTIDPDVQVKPVQDNNLSAFYKGREIITLGPQSKPDIPAWSFATLRTLIAARKVSTALRAADEEALYKAIFAAAVSTIDPYSHYANRIDAAGLRLVREGVIGLGARLELADDGALVKAIVNDGPAGNAGLKLNDVIVQANGVSLKNRQLADVRHRLDGVAGTTVNLTVRRAGERNPLIVPVALDLVVPDTVTGNVKDSILELGVRAFNQRTASAVENAVTEARRDGKLKGIVLDLRGNTGGLLDQAIDIADLFLDKGTIITLHGRNSGANQFYTAQPGDVAEGLPIAVIVDGKSASAAEIVAAALQDNHRAAVVGTVSWGKGSVQTIRRLPNSGELTMTWARVTTPRGAALHGLGLMPNVCLSGERASATEAINRMMAGTSRNDDIQRRWHAPADDPNIHEALRADCPAETRGGRALDLEVARQIVGNPMLLARAIPDGAPQLAARP